ncbi:MAG TPA: hypothetical protein VHE34_31000 [Puia sp.]|uniref:hypothetical protein n=1 Tax=Puia sp. TaxID=2045100 RepID=UPI002C0E40CC|nr:hypothetical protein [Puia sp.]HVU99705.1 hypothetical protein [Puia sp.]
MAEIAADVPQEQKFPDYLNKLIEGCSTHTKVSVQAWVSAATLSVITITHIKDPTGTISLPFNLGTVSDNAFYPIAFAVISLLFMCFASAVCQAIRSRSLIQRAIRNLDKAMFGKSIYPQDVVDAALYPTLNRVGPLAHILHGKKQFFPELLDASPFSRIVAGIWYVLLRFVACFCLYGLPLYALWTSYCAIFAGPTHLNFLLSLVFWIISGCVLIIFIELIVMDILYTIRGAKRINANNPNNF